MKFILTLALVVVSGIAVFGQEFTKENGSRSLQFDSLDVQILKRADAILSSESIWNKEDDRKCQDDIASNKYSLFCALYKASLDVVGKYDHRKPGLQQLRWLIQEQFKERLVHHRLMDFNNHEKTTFDEIKKLLNQSILITAQKADYRKYGNTETTKYQNVEDKVNNLIQSGELIGAEILIIENNKEKLHKSFGWADKESKKKLENGSIWTIMSMTKPFTATAVLMLMDEGKLSLDDSITKYIPSFKGNPQITIRNLLEQSSGDNGEYGNGGYNVTQFESLEDWVLDWAQQKSTGEFGKFEYSNFNYGALAYIVQKVSGISIDTFFIERIINPLELKNTYVKFDSKSAWAKKVPNRYEWNKENRGFEKFWSNNEQPSWKFLSGSLGLWMSAKDYATFMQMWLNKGKYGNHEILKESTVEEALKLHVNSYGEKHFGHGYGWFVEDNPLVFRYGGSAGGLGKAIISKNSIAIYMNHCGNSKHKTEFENALDKIWFPNKN